MRGSPVSQLHTQMLRRAADKLGGLDELARYLGVAPVTVRVWIRGLVAPPDDVFLILVDLLQEPPPGRPPLPYSRAPKGKAPSRS